MESIDAYPCKNNGTCLANGPSAFSCTCQPGFQGFLCENDIDECDSSPCINGGTCFDKIDDFECICPPGFTGHSCQNDEICHHVLCENGGTCLSVNENTDFQCRCKNGYTGRVCQTEIDFCASDPCQNGGSCTNVGDNYECSCLRNFVGSNCEENNRCMWVEQEIGLKPCFNGGTCLNEGNQHRCQCPSGFIGVACETGLNGPSENRLTEAEKCRAEAMEAAQVATTNLQNCEQTKQNNLDEYQKDVRKTVREFKRDIRQCRRDPLNLRAVFQRPQCKVWRTSFSNEPLLRSLRRRKYTFAIIGGEYYWSNIRYWTSATGDSYSKSDSQFPFRYHSAAALPNGHVLATGGMDGSDKTSKKYYHLDLTDGLDIKKSGDMPRSTRKHLASASLPDGRVIVCGGYDDTYLSSCIIYDDGRWSNASSMESKRGYLGMASDGHFVYAVGGYDGDNFLESAERYNGITDQWESIKALPGSYRWGLALVYADSRIFAIGGTGGNKQVEVYNTISQTWSRGRNLKRIRVKHSAVATPDGSIWVFGGNRDPKSVEVLPAGSDEWIIWPHSLSRPVMNAQVVLL